MAERQPSSLDHDVSILVVDDTRFTVEMLRRTLHGQGFFDVRTAATAREALESLDARPADIVLADWMMPRMDGLALTRRIRQHDEDSSHYTYILLLTAQDGTEPLARAFDQGVDDFVHKSHDHQELVARISAAARIARLKNELVHANRRLLDMNRQLLSRDGFDVATGLGNRTYVRRRLQALLRHVEGRGGTGLCGLIRIEGLDELQRREGGAVRDEVLVAAANRLQTTVRPLDIIGRCGDASFALLLVHEGGDVLHPNTFRRLHTAFDRRAYKTSGGFLNAGASLSIVALKAPWQSVPDADAVLDLASSRLDQSHATGQPVMTTWR